MANTLIKNTAEPGSGGGGSGGGEVGGGSGGGTFPAPGTSCYEGMQIAFAQMFPSCVIDYVTLATGGGYWRATEPSQQVWMVTGVDCSSGYVRLTYKLVQRGWPQSD